MQFSIEKEVFLKGLARVQGIVEKNSIKPITSNALIKVYLNGVLQTTPAQYSFNSGNNIVTFYTYLDKPNRAILCNYLDRKVVEWNI